MVRGGGETEGRDSGGEREKEMGREIKGKKRDAEDERGDRWVGEESRGERYGKSTTNTTLMLQR